MSLGRRLLGRSPEEAQALGFRALRLDTERRVEAALRPYRNCGFTEIPDYDGNPRAQIWMELRLRGY